MIFSETNFENTKRGKEKILRRPGIEPGSTAWKAAMLTTIPPTPSHNTSLNYNSIIQQQPEQYVVERMYLSRYEVIR